jgi:putative transposase
MSRSYRVFTDNHYAYFVTWTLVGWVHLFDKVSYRQIVLDSLNYLRTEKKTQLNAFVIMSSHIHAILLPEIDVNLSDVTRDFKRFTSRKISKEAEKQNATEVLKIFKKREMKIAHRMFQHTRSGKKDHTQKPSLLKNLQDRKWTIHMNPVKQAWSKQPMNGPFPVPVPTYLEKKPIHRRIC